MPIVLPPSQPAPLPDDQFTVRIDLMGGGCIGNVPVEVRELVEDGVSLSLVEVIRNGTLFFEQEPKLRPGETKRMARVRKAFELLEDWEPRVATDISGAAKLVVNGTASGEASGRLSEFLGEAVGLEIGIRLTNIDFPQWSKRHYKKNVPHDYDAEGSFGPVRLEARGRFSGNNIDNAINGIIAKFDKLEASGHPRKYSRTIGSLYCPRPVHELDSDYPDLYLSDPEDDVPRSPDPERYRRLLAHYGAVLEIQGHYRVAALLTDFARRDASWILDSIGRGKDLLPQPRLVGGDEWGRTSIRVDRTNYWGTFWGDQGLPSMTVQPGRSARDAGPTFFGLAFDVIRALSQLDLAALDEMDAPSFVGRIGSYAYARATDATMLAYAVDGTDIVADHPGAT